MVRRVTKKVDSDEDDAREETSQPRGPISLRFYLGKLKKGELGFDLVERDKIICVFYGMIVGLSLVDSIRYVGGTSSEEKIWSEKLQEYLRSKGVNIDGEYRLTEYCAGIGKAFFQGAQHSKTNVACDSNMLRHVGENIYQQTKKGPGAIGQFAIVDYHADFKPGDEDNEILDNS